MPISSDPFMEAVKRAKKQDLRDRKLQKDKAKRREKNKTARQSRRKNR